MTSYGFVHLEFGDQHRDRSLQVLEKLRTRLAQDGDRFSSVIVDNARARPAESTTGMASEQGLVVPGDNSNREFSGWDSGVETLLARGEQPDVWLFSNDTVALNHAWSERRLERFGGEIRKLALHPGPWLFGEINDFPRSTMTPMGPLLEWVSTYCFAMNDTLRHRLGTLSPGNALLDSLVNERFEPGRGVFRDHVGEAYVDFVSAWLISDEGQGMQKKRRFKWDHEWHKASPLGPDNFEDLRMKARCCLSEHMLSLRARQLGADIRSPYDARNAREHIRRSLQFLSDKLWEKFLLRRLRLERS
ncbi:hypothetical protein WDL1CHR_06115 [Variovorax sp. WDL1]|uniref:hypothetical protein n=1 Tax=Variovorax sp. WDL1 TaxID=207745 RepID=UPI00076CC610|nr:hypothetical protein [Variovorax sp. WDL1]KWT74104.1 hypothetical protein APY03_5658 [Variovorax sp. WDL1]PNG52204.1 hypothetical protein CHC07_04575 [Variovorax sp. B4]PNG54744.1 hypothetical protein CHC06_03541 [Variovorax sp. B2]VTV15737.1 hypothetical protein WDL1CHR_06115 [Variovorax sp. WDL1]